ncbi:hypothetical protein E2C01_012667 [Portunus trituberculatus]|uniref:Uncharacterized protein n=1 Tax=Portunus trituberculatus TaxID=210409 RepID=A0A5B7DE91_PORTR|nr:hypothetical protein [Portunus trituberculatus]
MAAHPVPSRSAFPDAGDSSHTLISYSTSVAPSFLSLWPLRHTRKGGEGHPLAQGKQCAVSRMALSYQVSDGKKPLTWERPDGDLVTFGS